jgi:anti-sigma regulatory factor (Ser/Thr protein kinase)
VFNQEVLLAVTNGRLLLCDDVEIARMLRGERILRCLLTEPRHVTEMRQSARRELMSRSRLGKRLYDLEASATEAATNALKHGHGGYFELWDQGDNVLALIVDYGSGIEPHQIARATLDRGYSTQVSLGLGFKMMWELADLIAVSTGPEGTTILIRIGEGASRAPEEDLIDRFPSLGD